MLLYKTIFIIWFDLNKLYRISKNTKRFRHKFWQLTKYSTPKKKCTKNRVISFIIDDEIHFSVYYSLGSGSDMATFYQRAGVPSIDMWFTYDEVSASVLLKTLICHLQN